MRTPLLALAIVCAQACAPLPSPSPEGEALHRALEGAWCNSGDGGRSCWAWDRFFPDGMFTACGRHEDESRPFSGGGRVTVEGRTMCYTVTEATENFWLRPGDRYCTEIVAIDEHMHRYRDIDTGAEFTLYRRAESQVRCPGPEKQ